MDEAEVLLLTSRAEVAEELLASSQAEAEKLRSDLSSSQSTLKSCQDECESLEKQLLDLTAKCARLEGRLEASAGTLPMLKMTLEGVMGQFREMMNAEQEELPAPQYNIKVVRDGAYRMTDLIVTPKESSK